MSTGTTADALELAREARDLLIEAADEAIRLAEAGQFAEALDVAAETAREAKALKSALQDVLIRAAGVGPLAAEKILTEASRRHVGVQYGDRNTQVNTFGSTR